MNDARLPLIEVLRCEDVPWSARAVSRRFCAELEAGREELHIRWTHVASRDVPSGGIVSGKCCPVYRSSRAWMLVAVHLATWRRWRCHD